MKRSIAIFLALSFLGAVFVITTAVLVFRITPEHRRRSAMLWLLGWFFKGLLVPVLLWGVMNIGISFELHAFMPDIQVAQNTGGKWWLPLARFTGFGIFIVTSYWMALTFGWTVFKTGSSLEGPTRKDFRALCLTCGAAFILPAVLIEALGGLSTLGLAAATILGPIVGTAPLILETRKLPPMYARAIARVKFGKYAEAEMEIIKELEKCEDDFEGWLMLAELYATHFNDLSEAEQTVLEICDHPKTSPSQLSVALHKLSNWHFKLAQDPEAARRALQVICRRLPGTHLARMAQLRMNQIPTTVEQLREQLEPKPIPLPSLHDPLDDEKISIAPTMTSQQATEAAKKCVERLHHDPNDISAREKLARLLAENLGQADRGIEQLGLLLNLPEQTENKRAEWLATIASWHLTQRHDSEAARSALQRLLREFPQCPQAFAARRRLQMLDSSSCTL